MIYQDIKTLEIYHYWDGEDWKSFSLSKENGPKWNLFCQRLMMSRPNDHKPYFEDYIKFLNGIKDK